MNPDYNDIVDCIFMGDYAVEVKDGYISGFKRKEDMKTGQFIVGSIIQADANNAEGISLARSPRPHQSKMLAMNEAERLARLEPGKRFVVLKLEGIVVAQGTVWS